MMQTKALIGIAVVVIIIVAVAALALSGSKAPASTSGGTYNGAPGFAQGTTGSGISYQYAASSGASASGIKQPGTGWYYCAYAVDQGNATASSTGTSEGDDGNGGANVCGPLGSTTAVSIIGLEVDNFAYGTADPAEFGNATALGSTNDTYNYYVNYTGGLVETMAACVGGQCSLHVPSGCSMAEHPSYGNTTAFLAICANQPTGEYTVSIDYSQNASVAIGTSVFH